MLNTQLVNAALQIVRMNNVKFQAVGGYYMPSGYSFHHAELGYLAFPDHKGVPYRPAGGKNALQSILDTGGFVSFEDIVWLQEMK
jgi:hypothetical protein